MERVDSLDEMFQWRTPSCGTVLNDGMGLEGTIPSLQVEDMLVDIELPETNLGPKEAAPASHPNPLSISLSPPNPVSIPFLPSHSSKTIVVSSGIQAPADTRHPLTVNTKPSSVQTGTRGFEIPDPSTTPMSSTPNTPPVVKPKSSHGCGTTKQKCLPKKKKSPQGLDAAGPKSKANRVPTTAEHIIRERQRRDDMSAKYSILESLLPPAPKGSRWHLYQQNISGEVAKWYVPNVDVHYYLSGKVEFWGWPRERAVVVEDGISFVGALQRKKAQLLNRRADLKLMASYNQSPRSNNTRSLAPLPAPIVAAVNPFQCHLTKQRSAPENCTSDSRFSGSSNGVQVDPVLVTSAGTISGIHVHIGEQKVVMEMVWNKPRPNFQSALLQAVQSLGFDVTECSILRVGKESIQCTVTCSKSQVLSQRMSEIQSSSTLIVRVLRNMLTQS